MSDRLLKESDVLREVESLLISDETRLLNDLEYGNNQALYHVINRIEDLPSADRPQGEWIIHKDWLDEGFCGYECPKCGRCYDYAMNFCGFCGADMRKEKIGDSDNI